RRCPSRGCPRLTTVSSVILLDPEKQANIIFLLAVSLGFLRSAALISSSKKISPLR
ncbi:hypothetical protein A2U01_0048487, partial [Trifolium medium]|nr:hypothetical protein [Trifolium medium]